MRESMIEPIEVANGENWVRCSAREPKPGKEYQGCRVYHPDARDDGSDSTGQDDHYVCPHCGDSWWVENDG